MVDKLKSAQLETLLVETALCGDGGDSGYFNWQYFTNINGKDLCLFVGA